MKTIWLVIILYPLFFSSYKCALNFGNESTKIRQRRGLIFNDGGVNKMVFGAIYPLYLEDPIKWRQLNCGYNIQAQYSVPINPLYVWDKWEGRSLRSMKKQFEKYGFCGPDESRVFVYVILETYMTNQGKNGHKCLLRAICENAQIDETVGIFADIIHEILSPGKNRIDDDYHDSYDAGKAGADCLRLYPECPKGDAFIDSLAVDLYEYI